MAATTRWLNNDQTILLHEFSGKWSTPEFETEIFGATPLIVNRNTNVVVVIDMTQYTMPPRDLNMFAMLSRFNNRRPDNIKMTVVVTDNTFASSLLTLARKILPKTEIMFMAKSLDQAVELIAKETGIR